MAMSAGLAQRVSAVFECRANEQAVALRPGKTEVGSSDIADHRETTIEHAAHDLAGVGRQQCRWAGLVGPKISGMGGHVHVRIDQAGQHETAAGVDDRYFAGGLTCADTDLDDLSPGDTNVALG